MKQSKKLQRFISRVIFTRHALDRMNQYNLSFSYIRRAIKYSRIDVLPFDKKLLHLKEGRGLLTYRYGCKLLMIFDGYKLITIHRKESYKNIW